MLTIGIAPETAAKARASLKKAIALRPDFHDSYNLLAYLNLVMGTEVDETIELLNGALARSPERIDYRYMLGQLYMHKDDYKQARPLLERVVASNLEANVRSHAQKLLGVMTEIEELEVKREVARRARGFATSQWNSTANRGGGEPGGKRSLRQIFAKRFIRASDWRSASCRCSHRNRMRSKRACLCCSDTRTHACVYGPTAFNKYVE